MTQQSLPRWRDPGTIHWFGMTATVLINLLALIFFFGQLYERITGLEKQIDKRFEQVDKRFDRIENRLERVEERLAKVEAEVSVWRDNLTKRVEALERKNK